MSTYNHAVRYVSERVWAISKPTLEVIVNVLGMREAGITMSHEEIQARIGAATRGSGATTAGTVAVLPLYGVIDHKVTMMSEISGGTAVTGFMQAFRQLRDDASISAIIIDVDSPGGSVFGIEEAADEIYQSRGVKPTVAMVNPECGSAALWIATACKEVVCTPSGMIGSLGCYTVHLDRSEANAKIGIKPTYIAYGENKVAGHPDAPLDEETHAYMLKQVNAIGEKFVRAVARGRNVSLKKVRDEFGQGRMFSSEDALAVGMVDRVATFEQTVERLGGRRKRGGARAEDYRPEIAAETVIDEQIAAVSASLDATGEKLATLGEKLTAGLELPIEAVGEAASVAAEEFETSMADVAATVNLDAQREADADYMDAAIRIAERL